MVVMQGVGAEISIMLRILRDFVQKKFNWQQTFNTAKPKTNLTAFKAKLALNSDLRSTFTDFKCEKKLRNQYILEKYEKSTFWYIW